MTSHISLYGRTWADPRRSKRKRFVALRRADGAKNFFPTRRAAEIWLALKPIV